MAQKPIRLQQLGITLDDIMVHLENAPMVKREVVEKVVKEVDEEKVNQLVDNLVKQQTKQIEEKVRKHVKEEIDKIPPPAPQAPMQLSLDEGSIKRIVHKEIKKIPPPEQKVTNQIVEKIDESAVRNVVIDQLNKHITEQVNKQVFEEVFDNKFAQLVADGVISELFDKEFVKRTPSPPPEPELNLTQYKDKAMNEIDDLSAVVRSKYITDIIGQEALYAEKVDEAVDFVSEGYKSNISNFPLLEAEVKATQKSPKDVADKIIEKRAEWIHINARIEEERLRGKTIIGSVEINTKEAVDKIANQTKSVLKTI